MSRTKIELPIDDSLSWRPTFWWKNRTEIIACEVTERPYLKSFENLFADVISKNVYVKIIIASPEPVDLSALEHRKDLQKLKGFGFGHLCIGDSEPSVFDFLGLPVPMFITEPKYESLKSKLRPCIRESFRMYMTEGNPDHGVQELGQIVENIIYNLGDQACAKSKLTLGGYCSRTGHYAINQLIEDLIRERIIDVGVLGRCRGFMDDRNGYSHRPRSIREALRRALLLKECWNVAVRILEDIPEKLRIKGYNLKID